MCPGVRVTRVCAIENSSLQSAFSARRSILEDRARSSGFSPEVLNSLKEPAKIKALQVLKTHTTKLQGVYGLMWVFHGTSHANAMKIARSGMCTCTCSPLPSAATSAHSLTVCALALATGFVGLKLNPEDQGYFGR
jgi:hypothetical protein